MNNEMFKVSKEEENNVKNYLKMIDNKPIYNYVYKELSREEQKEIIKHYMSTYVSESTDKKKKMKIQSLTDIYVQYLKNINIEDLELFKYLRELQKECFLNAEQLNKISNYLAEYLNFIIDIFAGSVRVKVYHNKQCLKLKMSELIHKKIQEYYKTTKGNIDN